MEEKRHKLIGWSSIDNTDTNIESSKKKKIGIIGSGIAASSAAYAAAQNGANVEIFESADDIAAGASGNPVAALYPRFSINNSPYSFLTAQSYFFAEKLYSQMPNAYMQTGLLFSHSNDYQTQWIEEMKHLNRKDLFEIIDTKKMKKLYGFRISWSVGKKRWLLISKINLQRITRSSKY